MTPREIIAEAWALTKRERGLRGWGFASAFFETTLDIKLIGYQIYFVYELLSGHQGSGFFDVEIRIYQTMPQWFFWTFVIFFAVMFLVEIVFPSLASGAIIGLAAKSHRKEPVKGGLILALYNFLPLFAAHEIFVFASTSLAITIVSQIVRYVSGDMRIFMIGVIIFFWVITNLLKLCAAFTPQGIVIQRLGIFEAMGKSFKLFLSQLGQIMFVLVLLFVISIRVFINAIVILVIPGIVMGLGFLLIHVLSPVVTYVIAGMVGLLLILIASYFFGYLHTFKQTVWTLMFIELRKHKELDVIEE